MKNFRTYDMAVAFYEQCQTLKLKQPLKNQFDRCTLSVVLNLAEGSGKPTSADRKRFYAIALGSLRETQALLRLAKAAELTRQADLLGAYLYKLQQNPGGT
jgi:four helix bundle protein